MASHTRRALYAAVLGCACAYFLPCAQVFSKPGRKSASDHDIVTSALDQFGRGVNLVTTDRQFRLNVGLRVQFRYTYRYEKPIHLAEQANEAEVQRTAHRHILNDRRARAVFRGHLFGGENRFKVEISITPRDIIGFEADGSLSPFLTWYFEFAQLRDANLRLGQYKIPFSRERVISSANLQFVDRSLANEEFNLDRDVGIDLRSSDLFGVNRCRYAVYIGLGDGRDRFDAATLSFLYIVRFELFPFGLFDSYRQSDLDRFSKVRLSMGVAYAFLDDGSKNRGILGDVPADGGTSDMHLLTADMSFKWYGVSVEGEFFARLGARRSGNTNDEQSETPVALESLRRGVGWSGQLGYLFGPLPVEVAGRYGTTQPVSESSLPKRHELGFAVSYYLTGHPLKLQLDYFNRWRQPAQGVSYTLRVQLQLSL